MRALSKSQRGANDCQIANVNFLIQCSALKRLGVSCREPILAARLSASSTPDCATACIRQVTKRYIMSPTLGLMAMQAVSRFWPRGYKYKNYQVAFASWLDKNNI
jgi:hypothetical protein